MIVLIFHHHLININIVNISHTPFKYMLMIDKGSRRVFRRSSGADPGGGGCGSWGSKHHKDGKKRCACACENAKF